MKLNDFLSKLVFSKSATRADRLNDELEKNQQFMFGEVYQKHPCDCDPWVDHGMHWVPARRLDPNGAKL